MITCWSSITKSAKEYYCNGSYKVIPLNSFTNTDEFAKIEWLDVLIVSPLRPNIDRQIDSPHINSSHSSVKIITTYFIILTMTMGLLGSKINNTSRKREGINKKKNFKNKCAVEKKRDMPEARFELAAFCLRDRRANHCAIPAHFLREKSQGSC
jgi:hypothetical protein